LQRPLAECGSPQRLNVLFRYWQLLSTSVHGAEYVEVIIASAAEAATVGAMLTKHLREN